MGRTRCHSVVLIAVCSTLGSSLLQGCSATGAASGRGAPSTVGGAGGSSDKGGGAGTSSSAASGGAGAGSTGSTTAAGTSNSGGTQNEAGNGGTRAGAGGGTTGEDLPSNLSTGKSEVIADSQEGANLATQGNDGNGTTRWCPAGSTPAEGRWWSVDLGASHALTQINIRWEFYRGTAVYNYKIESCSGEVTRELRQQPCNETNALCADLTCSDANGWKLLVDKTASGSTAQQKFHELSLQARPTARHLKITITEVSNGWACFEEFDVLGY